MVQVFCLFMQISPVNQNKPAFKADIMVFNRALFQTLPLGHMKATGNYLTDSYSVESAKFLSEGLTDGASVCTAGYIHNGENGFLFHCIPYFNGQKEVSELLQSAFEKLSENNKKISAFLTGGNTDAQVSVDLYMMLKKAFCDFEVPCSSIWGNKNTAGCTSSDLFVSASKRQYIVCPNTWSNSYTQIESLEDINKLYAIVDIHNNDRLVFPA